MEPKIFVYTRYQNDFAKTFNEFVSACRDSDLLRCGRESRGSFGSSDYAHFVLGNKTVSRKKWEIVFRAFYQ